MLILKILVMGLCAVLFWFGGYSWHNARRFIMPSVLTSACVFITHSYWTILMLSSIGFLCLGYGDNSPFRRIFGNGFGRGVWGFLVGLGFSLILFITGHLSWYFFWAYLLVSFILENSLKNINQKIGDPIIGAAFGSIVFLIH